MQVSHGYQSISFIICLASAASFVRFTPFVHISLVLALCLAVDLHDVIPGCTLERHLFTGGLADAMRAAVLHADFGKRKLNLLPNAEFDVNG